MKTTNSEKENPLRKKRRLSLSLKDKRFATPLAERDMQKVCEGFTPKNATLNYWLSRFVVECRRGDGKAYPASTLYQLLAQLQINAD